MKAVSAWTTSDGQIFTDNKQAQKHEQRILRKAALENLSEKIADQLDRESGGEVRVDGVTILGMLLDNADELLAGLSAKPATNRGRKKQEAAAA